MSSNRLIFGSIVILSDDAPLLRREPDQPEKDAPKPSGITTVPAGIAAIPASTNRSLNLDEALAFLAEKFREVAAEIKALPAESFPDDFAVVELILQPGRLNADNYPRHFFQGLNLTVLSSRYVKRRLRHLQGQSPEQPERPESSRDCLALHLAGRKSDLAEAARKIAHLEPKAFSQMAFLEGVLLPSPEQKVKACGVSAADCFETVLSLLPGRDDSFPCSQFRQYAESLGFQVLDHHREIVKNTAFIPVRGPRAALVKLAEFAFVRQILDVPKMRPFRPFNPLRSLNPESDSAARPDESEPEVPPAQTSPEKPPAAGAATAPFSLPPLPENLPDLGVAILDGGLPPEHPLDKALKAYVKVNPEADDDPGSPEHGLAVTSAFLCGSLPRQGQAQCPYSKVTAVRVLDAESADDAVDTFYKTLRNVKKTLETGEYKFVNLSLGPDVVVQDDHIHVWTSVIDELAYRKGLFVTVAAGNNGLSRLDGVSPERMLSARIQVPSDAVNVLSVGALDRQRADWRRSYFSAIGPGRKPTVMKPDLVSFGGGDDEPFLVLAPSGEIQEADEEGTSFAAPNLLRAAVGLAALAGDETSLTTIKALLIHYAVQKDHQPQEVGWGSPPEPEQILLGLDGEERHLFQGRLRPGERHLARFSTASLTGRVEIKATFCFSSHVSANNPSEYLLTALEADFLTDVGYLAAEDGSSATAAPAAVKPFFDLDGGEFDDETDPQAVSRANVKRNEMILDASELTKPGFAICQVAKNESDGEEVEYSLIVSLSQAPPEKEKASR